MKESDVTAFDRVRAQLRQLHAEIALLSKSKPDNPLNQFKLSFINEKLTETNAILKDEFRPFKDFTLFASEKLPSNSDVTIVLSQYLEALEGWRCSHIVHHSYHWRWDIPGTDIQTDPPTRSTNR